MCIPELDRRESGPEFESFSPKKLPVIDPAVKIGDLQYPVWVMAGTLAAARPRAASDSVAHVLRMYKDARPLHIVCTASME